MRIFDFHLAFVGIFISVNLLPIPQATASPTLSPAFSPSYAPTAIPTPVSDIPITLDPIAPPQIISIDPAGNILIRLTFFDASTTDFQYYIKNMTGTGLLYQLSPNFVKYGYEPKNGRKITFNPPVSPLPAATSSPSADPRGILVTDPMHRVYYARPSPDRAPLNQKLATIEFVVLRTRDQVVSQTGTITIVSSSSGALVGSDFSSPSLAPAATATVSAASLTSRLADNWQIVGNLPHSAKYPSHESYRLQQLLNHYIVGREDAIDLQSATDNLDARLWYFEAPPKFLGNQVVAYRGSLSFTLAALAGDFRNVNDPSRTHLLELYCADCAGPVSRGRTLFYPLSRLFVPFTGPAQVISVPLIETAGWLLDPQDVLKTAVAPAACEFMEVLGRLSAVRILGDFTLGDEMIALDDVVVANTNMYVPLCALFLPDASICQCDA